MSLSLYRSTGWTPFLRFFFLDPSSRERVVNWEAFAEASVGALRRELGRRPDDRRLLDLVEELRAADPDVSRWWDDHSVRDYASVSKRILHPDVGELSFDIEAVVAPQEPDQRLVIYTASAVRDLIVYDETGASSCAWAARSLSQILTMAAMSSSSSGSMK